MSPQASHPLPKSDLLVLRNWLSQIAVGFFLLGVYATLAATAIYLFLARGRSYSKARMGLLFLTSFMLLSSICSTIVKMEFNLLQLPFFGSSIPQPSEIIHLRANILIASSIFDRFNYVISDGIVVWRAWILFPRNLAVKGILTVCMIASFAGAFVNGTRVVIKEMKDVGGSVPRSNALILAIPLFTTNLVVTLLVGYKAWAHFQDIRRNLGQTDGSGKLQKILLLLIESGIIYSILWMLDGVMNISSYTSTLPIQIFGSAMPNLSGIYPILIILIAAFEYAQPTNLNEMSLSQSIRFAFTPGSQISN